MYPDTINLQLHVGILQYRRHFGRRSTGFWLPECGYFRGLDDHLRRWGINYLFLARHGLLNGDPAPRSGEFAAVQTPSGARAFARDVATDHQVAFKGIGYPGDPLYADFKSDIGLIWPSGSVRELTHLDGPATTGIRCCRAGGAAWELYDPEAAAARCEVHAAHFVQQCQQRAESLAVPTVRLLICP